MDSYQYCLLIQCQHHFPIIIDIAKRQQKQENPPFTVPSRYIRSSRSQGSTSSDTVVVLNLPPQSLQHPMMLSPRLIELTITVLRLEFDLEVAGSMRRTRHSCIDYLSGYEESETKF